MESDGIKKTKSKQIVISADNAGRRIDNYLIGYFDNMPKSRIYQMLRKGEVRVNKGRIKQTYRLEQGDIVRLPPVFQNLTNKTEPNKNLKQIMLDSIIYEDDGLLMLNKPTNFAVHGGTGQSHGIIEIIRSIDNKFSRLELVHRLDKATSGCLLFAKSMPILKALHDAIKNGEIKKTYFALLAGQIKHKTWTLDQPLKKNTLRSGERIVTVDKQGKKAITIFYREKLFKDATLVRVELITGRTHQIRVHSATSGHPVLGDPKYGNREINRNFKKIGLKRMFLHAASLELISPVTGKNIVLEAPLAPDLIRILDNLNNQID